MKKTVTVGLILADVAFNGVSDYIKESKDRVTAIRQSYSCSIMVAKDAYIAFIKLDLLK